MCIRDRVTAEDRYWLSRRSLRIWPVPGPDIKASLRDYLSTKLKLNSKFLHDIGDISIRKVAEAPGSRISDEVIAVFSTVAVRDAIKRAARELGGEAGFGIRHEIPNALQSSLKALEALSFHLKQKHPGIKRNIKFDDMTKDLVLDFSINPDAGDWKRVTATQAVQMKTKFSRGNTEVTNNELESLLGGS